MIGFLFNEILTRPLITILAGVYHGLVAIHAPYPLGFALILLTVVVRLILYPFTHSQLKTSKKMQELSPHLSLLKEKHKNDNTRLQQETMKLYKEHGVNPAAGCLPMLIQLPIIWSLYGAFQKIVGLSPKAVVSYINSQVYVSSFKLGAPWDQHFFGLPLGHSPADLMKTMPFILLIPVLTALFQFVQSKMMIAPQAANTKKNQDDFASAFQTQSMFIFPFMIGLFSYRLPVGLSLYWNTFTIFGILQQYQLQGWGGLIGKKQITASPKKK